MIELGTGRLVGFRGLFDITRALVATMFEGVGEAALRGRGYGTEASRPICEYGFFFRNLHSIKVEVHGYNRTALRLYERLGFKVVGHLRRANLVNNRRYDAIIMDLVRGEFELKHVARFQDLESEHWPHGRFDWGKEETCRLHRRHGSSLWQFDATRPHRGKRPIGL